MMVTKSLDIAGSRKKKVTIGLYYYKGCSAKQALSKRDLSDQDILSSLDQIHGNTQDFLAYVKEKKTKICVVAIDYAGFTTNISDLKNLLKEHSNIQKVMIEAWIWTG
ncbi:hypothetical protein CU097_011871 [Rhizopus azygosporus]|uniref:Uncharacterized protein n=1 Tax=Rhizopus azygosporus TaxID=86630 RepID=A0A367JIP0_RHIAZ|nr:hypothetical protein CU097_011871 [Rhizopus azygosporus]